MATIVDCFDQSVENLHEFCRERLPFTYIAYRSLIPEKGDDWYYLAEKVAWVSFLVFQLIEFAASISLWIALIPVIPLALDAMRLSYREVCHRECEIPPSVLKAIQAVGFAIFSLMGVAFLFDQMRILTVCGDQSWLHRHR